MYYIYTWRNLLCYKLFPPHEYTKHKLIILFTNKDLNIYIKQWLFINLKVYYLSPIYIYIYIYININNGGDYVSEIPYKIISKIIAQIYKGDITEW